jgi:hypothetical protein
MARGRKRPPIRGGRTLLAGWLAVEAWKAVWAVREDGERSVVGQIGAMGLCLTMRGCSWVEDDMMGGLERVVSAHSDGVNGEGDERDLLVREFAPCHG